MIPVEQRAAESHPDEHFLPEFPVDLRADSPADCRADFLDDRLRLPVFPEEPDVPAAQAR